MHFSKPVPHDYRRSPDAGEMLKDRLGEVFNLLKEQGLRKGEITLGFVDETSPQNRANTIRVWRCEKSPGAIKNTDHFKSNTLGFYAIQGDSVQALSC